MLSREQRVALWERLVPGRFDSENPLLSTEDNGDATDAPVTGFAALAEVQLHVARLAERFGCRHLDRRVISTVELLDALTDAVADGGGGHNAVLAAELRAERVSHKKTKDELLVALAGSNKAAVELEKLREAQVCASESIRTAIKARDAAHTELKVAQEELAVLRKARETTEEKLREISEAAAAEKKAAWTHQDELEAKLKEREVRLQNALRRTARLRDARSKIPGVFVRFLQKNCDVLDPSGVLDELLRRLQAFDRFTTPGQVVIDIRKTDDKPFPPVPEVILPDDDECVTSSDDGTGGSDKPHAAPVPKRSSGKRKLDLGSDMVAREADDRGKRRRPPSSGKEEIVLPTGAKMMVNLPPLEDVELPSGVAAADVPREAFELMRRGLQYDVALALASSGHAIHQFLTREQIIGLAVIHLQESPHAAEHTWLVHVPEELLDATRADIAEDNEADAEEEDHVPGGSDDAVDDVDADEDSSEEGPRRPSRKARRNSESPRIPPLKKKEKRDHSAEDKTPKTKAKKGSTTKTPRSKASDVPDVLPLIRAGAPKEFDGINLKLEGNYAGFPNTSMPMGAVRIMTSRLDLAEYDALMAKKPWEQMYDERVRELRLVKRAELSEKSINVLQRATSIMFEHRRAFWEYYH